VFRFQENIAASHPIMQQQAGQPVFFVAAQEDAQYHEECNSLEEMRNYYSPAREKTMRTAELLELIRNGENSGVEFKRDDIRPEQLAKEIVALANLQGGRVLLGVEDNGAVTGIRRPDMQEWVGDVTDAFPERLISGIAPQKTCIITDSNLACASRGPA
jgi:alpha-galactosidase/6-phospho-beta-glucosidase family protein